MWDKFLQGRRACRLGRLHIVEAGTTDYCFHFYRSGIKIARMYYHPGAKQVVLDASDNISLTKETLLGLIPLLSMGAFRQERRRMQSLVKNGWKQPESEVT